MSEKKLPEILVMGRGFVLVGRTRPDPDDRLMLIVDDCCAVRRWGTTAGLGQLAIEGPQPETILDAEGDGVRINRRYLLRRIPCVGERWTSWTAPTPPASELMSRPKLGKDGYGDGYSDGYGTRDGNGWGCGYGDDSGGGDGQDDGHGDGYSDGYGDGHGGGYGGGQ